MSFRPTLWPTLITLPLVVAMVWLGFWQLQRLEWKRALIETMESRRAAPAIALPSSATGGKIDAEALDYRRVRAKGRLHHDKEIHLIAHTAVGRLGYHVITPLEREDGAFVLVNRGWVPTELKTPETRLAGQAPGELEITGIARLPWEGGGFVPDNDRLKNVWFYGDLAAMARHLELAPVAPVFIEADASPNPGGWPLGGQTRLSLSNDHLGYALTWFVLAGALIIIYVLYHRKRPPEG